MADSESDLRHQLIKPLPVIQRERLILSRIEINDCPDSSKYMLGITSGSRLEYLADGESAVRFGMASPSCSRYHEACVALFPTIRVQS